MREETPSPGKVGLPVVVARILVVTGVGLTAAVGLFLLIGGVWQLGIPFLAAMFLFIFLMFLLERFAPGSRGT